MGEVSEENLDEFTSDMIKRLKKSYSTMPKKLSTDQANALSRHLDRLDLTSLKQLSKENIPFLTTLARNKIYKKTGKFEDVNEQDGKIGPAGKIALAKEKDTDVLEKQLTAATGQIELLKQKLENEKNKTIKPVPNPETGEVPLTIGIANKLLKDKEEKEAKKKEVKEMAKDDAYAIGMAQAKKSMNDEPPLDKKTITKGHEIAKSIIKKEETLDEFTSNMIKRLQISYADLKGKTLSPEKATALSKHLDRLDTTSLRQLVKANIPFMSTLARNKIYKKTGKFEERRLYVESISGLQNKAEKSGMPYSILKKFMIEEWPLGKVDTDQVLVSTNGHLLE